ncbi:hypothetical protein JXD38_10895 [candidate division WOR-3 bacterium]|nr:hypothetical protein [candidate division WOR-3 bacterium]
MKQHVLLIVSLLAFGAAQDTIKPLFEARSVAEYDRWLWKHRNEYPGFRPVRVRVGEEHTGSGWTRLTAIFLTDSGTELVRHVYPDSWQGLRIQQVSNINVHEVGDHSVVYRRGASTAYDRCGRKLFDSDGSTFPGFNLWFRDSESPESTQVLNDEGKAIGVLPRVSSWTATGSGDTLMAAVSGSGTIVFDRKARIRWRDSMFGTAPRIAAISSNGRTVAVVTRDSVGLHDLVTGENKVLGFDTAMSASVRARSIALSDDGSLVAILYRVGERVPDSLLLRVLARDAKEVTPPYRLESDYLDNMFWMGDTVVLVASPGVPGDRGGKMYQTGPCKALAVTLNGDARTLTVPGVFGRLGVWYQQGRTLAYVDRHMGYFAVFRVPMH